MCPATARDPVGEEGAAGAAEGPPSKRLKLAGARIVTDAESRWQKKVRRAKRAARSELSVSKGGWQRQGFAADASLLATAHLTAGLPRVDARTLTPEQFVERFEKPGLPCVLTHATDAWPAVAAGRWDEAALLARCGDHKFKVGTDDNGYGVRLKLKHFLSYAGARDPHGAAADDSPLYVFDGTFAERDGSKSLAKDYSPPAVFKEDLMALAGERRRPPYRWIVIGPARSGTAVHVDPLGTSAWNALLQGHKRWAMFPPGSTKEMLKPPGVESEAATWFARVWPRTQSPSWPGPRPIDIVQGPGETVFVPGGWWHAVMNLDATGGGDSQLLQYGELSRGVAAVPAGTAQDGGQVARGAEGSAAGPCRSGSGVRCCGG